MICETPHKAGVEFSPDKTKATYWPGNGNVFHYTLRQGVYFQDSTPEPVIVALLNAKNARYRIRVHYGHTDETKDNCGHDWHEEYDVTGYVSNTMGPLKNIILVHNRRSTGGCCTLTDCIVKITTTGKNKRTLYQHPKYYNGTFTIRPIGPDELASPVADQPRKTMNELGYTHAVDIDGNNHANFRNESAAKRYIAKMGG
jgi:ABC-type transport system substrate-binding protein